VRLGLPHALTVLSDRPAWRYFHLYLLVDGLSTSK
jgi:hypothetical protein